MRGLALSGGALQGSFQVGALECLYTQFGYRPEVIAGTSVGSVNGLAIAQGRTPDEQLEQLNKLLGVWRNLSAPSHVYITKPWVQRLLRTEGLAFSSLPSPRIEDGIVELLFYNLEGEIERTTALAVLDPLEMKMRDPALYDKDKLAGGVPLRMVCVSLETGRVRYATGRGLFLEDDNFTPVASALPRVAVIRGPHDNFTSAIETVSTLIQTIIDVSQNKDKETKTKILPPLGIELESALWRAETAYEQLATANASLPTPIQATVDPVIGALASSAIPGIFEAYKIGQEHYIDGGVRETVPVRALVQMGATEVIAIVCSPQRMPKAGDAGYQDFLTNLLGSLTGITLKEVVEDDLAGRGTEGVPVTLIIPDLNVHDSGRVDMGLIHISMAYGYMRAADVMTPLTAAERHEAELLSDAISSMRRDTHLLSYTWTRPLEAGAHQMLLELRLRKWFIRKLVESRIASGVAIPSGASLWFQGWEQGSSGIPIISTPWQRFVTFADTTDAIDPYSYVPDMWIYEERGDLGGLYVIRGGAAFRGNPSTVAAVTGGRAEPDLTVPEGTTANLPSVPVPGTVLSEVAPAGASVQTSGTWFVDGVRRYLLNPAATTALGGPTATSIPSGGLAQIPNGGTPYWLGSLVVADSRPALIHRWEPTPQVEGSRTQTAVILWNQGTAARSVSDVQITTSKDTAFGRMFTVRTPLPLTVPAGQKVMLDVQFDAASPGPVTGTVAVECDDPIAPSLRIPLQTSVTPLGSHAELTLGPVPLEFGSTLISVPLGKDVTIRNAGSRAALLTAKIDTERPVGQFGVSTYSLINPLPAGEATSVYVSFTPTTRGEARAVLAIEMTSDTDVGTAKYEHRYDVPLSGVAAAPVLMLAGGPRRARPRTRPINPPPRPFDPNVETLVRPIPLQEPELTTLDFGTASVGTVVAKSFWIRNVGDAPLTVNGITFFGQMPFAVDDLSVFPLTLQPNEEVEVPSSFDTGSVPGRPAAGWFEISSNDPHRPTAVLNLIGRTAGPHLSRPAELGSAELLDFGPVTAPVSATLTFTSDGSDAVKAKDIQLIDGQAFSVATAPTLPATLNPGDALTVTATFTGQTPGNYQDRLELRHDGAQSGSSTFLLRATAV
jgi:NTE family protein